MGPEKPQFGGPPETPEEEIAFREERFQHTLEQMQRDALTQLRNRGSFWPIFKDALAREKEGSLKNVHIITIDIDHFKKINDTYGHSAGDEVLKRIGALLNDKVREPNTAARMGGEELMILMPNTDMKTARALAEDIRLEIGKMEFANMEKDENGNTITASFGIASSADEMDAQELYNLADVKMYRAKHNGRNRIEYMKVA